jgi:hypothetical protein
MFRPEYPSGLSGITFGEVTAAGIGADVPAYKPDRRDIPENRTIMKRRYVEPVKAPQL